MSEKKTQNSKKSWLTGASLLAAAAAISATPAMAQDVDEEEDIVVVGSRLVRQDFEAISPVTTVGSEQLELTATLTTESLLNELPQIIPGNTRTSNNAGGFDYATVDLRGLGPGRTLVLINGERVPVSSTAGAVDINTIPASLISRVEVVTGGASAVYGSDAMAGVVNFVLKDDYEGAEVTVTYGSEMSTGNAQEFEINGLIGGNFANGRGNMTTYASYYDREGVFQSEYDYSRVSAALCYDGYQVNGRYHVVPCDDASEVAANGWFPLFPGGSGTPPWGWIANGIDVDTDADGIRNASSGTAFGNPTYGCSDGTGAANVPGSGAADMGDDGICNDSDGTGIPDNGNGVYDGITGYLQGLSGVLPGTFGAGNTDTNCDGVAGGNVNTGNLSFNNAGQLTPRNTSYLCAIPDRSTGSSRYNYAPDNYIILPAERVALTTNGHYDFENNVRLNFLVNYTNSRTLIQLAPTPMTGIQVQLTPALQAYLNANHNDLWQALQTRGQPLAPFTLNRRTNEVGPRVGHFESNNFFFTASLEGSLGETWDWNLTGSYGQVMFNTRAENSVNFTAVQQGLAGCQDINGNSLGSLALPGCIQIDMFGPNTLTDEMADFIRVNTYNDTIIEENRLAGYVRGDLFQLPAGPIASVFGFEVRDTFAGSYNDNEQRMGNIAGFNAVQDQEGQIDVYELYTEMSVPLVSEAPFAHYLGLEGGYRISNYSSVGNVETYKIGGEWAPAEWLRFRGVFNAATRAPNVFEVFQAGDQGFPSYADPCNQAANQANCIAANGVAAGSGWAGPWAGFVQNNSQVQAFAFGNPNLSPESAETSTYGFVFQPDWFPVGDLRATVDYYDIEITDVIASVGAQFFLTDCYQNLTPSSCARIVRDQTNGQVLSVDTTRSNQGSLASSGYDIQFEWSVPVGPGQLTINELYSILESFEFNGNDLAGGTSGAIGGALPDYKSVLSVTYNVGDWTVFGRWSYVPSMYANGVCAAYFACDDTPEASYVDVSARWNVTDAFTLTANVDNVFDDYPPITSEGVLGGQGNTDPQVYRVLGRSFMLSGRYRF